MLTHLFPNGRLQMATFDIYQGKMWIIMMTVGKSEFCLIWLMILQNNTTTASRSLI